MSELNGAVPTKEIIKGTVAAPATMKGNMQAVFGKDGKSAYEIALANGFEGTEEEWLASLKGDRGESGVYLGSGEMPADCNVQIDPNGEAFDIDDVVAEAMSEILSPDGTIKSPAADFAEVGEWLDGNPNNEDRRGYFVCIDPDMPGPLIRIAKSTDDIRGAIMGIPGFAGNCTKDKFDEEGNLLPQYDYVGVMGLIPVIDNGTCTINGRCMPADDGTAIPSSNKLGYHVVDRIDEKTILVVIEPGADMIQRVKKDVKNCVAYTEQALTKEQQAQARENIDALGKVEEYVTTISPTEDSVMEGYIGPDGLVAKAPAYRCTDYIAIDFDDNSVVNIHGTFAGYAGTVFYDTNKKVLLVVNGHNITNYGESLINTAEWTQTAPVTLPVGVAFVRMTIATKDYTKPEDLWITGKKTANVIDMLKNIIAMDVKNATVSYEKQTLTPEQQAQARENIGAVGIETFEAEMGIMSDVLDELHNYAQALIGGEA